VWSSVVLFLSCVVLWCSCRAFVCVTFFSSCRYAEDPEATSSSFMVTENGSPHSLYTTVCSFSCVIHSERTDTHNKQRCIPSIYRYADDPEATFSSFMVTGNGVADSTDVCSFSFVRTHQHAHTQQATVNPPYVYRYADDPEATFPSFMVTENGVAFTPFVFVYTKLSMHTHTRSNGEPSVRLQVCGRSRSNFFFLYGHRERRRGLDRRAAPRLHHRTPRRHCSRNSLR